MQAQGMTTYPDLHLGETWADPGHQAGARSLLYSFVSRFSLLVTTPVLTHLCRRHPPDGPPPTSIHSPGKCIPTRGEVCNTFQEHRLDVEMISIGNEIRNGLLWSPTQCQQLLQHRASTTLRHKGSEGLQCDQHPQDHDPPRQWLVLDRARTILRSPYQRHPTGSSDFDYMGVSYYPFYGSGATLSALKTNLNNLHSTCREELIVVETDWPVSCSNPGYAFPPDLQHYTLFCGWSEGVSRTAGSCRERGPWCIGHLLLGVGWGG